MEGGLRWRDTQGGEAQGAKGKPRTTGADPGCSSRRRGAATASPSGSAPSYGSSGDASDGTCAFEPDVFMRKKTLKNPCVVDHDHGRDPVHSTAMPAGIDPSAWKKALQEDMDDRTHRKMLFCIRSGMCTLRPSFGGLHFAVVLAFCPALWSNGMQRNL